MTRKYIQETTALSLSALSSYSRSFVCFLVVTSLYFRWIPIYSGIVFAAILLLLVISEKSLPTVSTINKTALLFAGTMILHLACIGNDSLKHGFHPIFILDILNIATISLFILFIRTTCLDSFMPKLQHYQIAAGALLCLIPASLFILGIGSTTTEGHFLDITGKLSDFIKTNIDYNILAFLLLLSLNSLVFSKDARIPVITTSTIISFGILYSSSRRAFLILVFILPLIALARRGQYIKNYKKVTAGVGLAFLISTATIAYSSFHPFKSHISSKAVVQPFLRPLSFFMTPSEFNEFYYRIVHNINDHSHVSTENIDFEDSLGELAIQPRKSRITASLSIIDAFTPLQHFLGKSFFLRELGEINDLSVDYPHNFLLTSYISTGSIGAIAIFLILCIALIGLYRYHIEWALDAKIALLISISFSITSGFSYWSFLPLSLYSAIGTIAYFRRSKKLNPEA